MGKKSNNAANWTKHGYEATVKARALARAGGNPNLNGHILEIMGADKTNLNPANWVKGVRETLSASTTERAADSLVRQAGRVVEKVQYKDCSKSIGDVVRRVNAGQYQGTTLKGTTETAKVFNRYAAKHGLATRMKDTGISSNTTKSLGRACGACKQVPLAKAAAISARSGGIFGGAIAGGISAVSNLRAVARGEKDGWEAAGCIAKDTAGGALSGAGAAAAATATGGAVAAGVAGTAIAGTALGTVCVVAAPLAVALGVGWGISKLWSGIWD
ncbi:MAG: hypothetical protein IKQ55_05885 [Kiritimatiellae bacterium]|nr:hypothetical protein [Kiritimatiellia bacterium]